MSILKGAKANMDFDNNENITRKKFLKGVAGAALCCTCVSWSCSKLKSEEGRTAEEKFDPDGKDILHLAAACGTYCGACPAYLNKHGKKRKRVSSGPKKDSIDNFVDMMDKLLCDGCLSGGTLAAHCRTCNIRLCAANKQPDSRCSDCKELPCYRMTDLIKQGGYPHRQEYLPNLEKTRQMGVEKWVQYEVKRWRCTKCGLPMSWYDAQCAECGEPRSQRVFPLTKKDGNQS
jgi:hypothetical protein